MLPLTFPAPRACSCLLLCFRLDLGTPLAQLLLGAGMSLTALAQGLTYSRCSIYERCNLALPLPHVLSGWGQL